MRLLIIAVTAVVLAWAQQALAETASDEKAAPDYYAAKWHPLHFKPAIDTAKDEDCLGCHREIIERLPLEVSPAGVAAADSLAWYQTLDTYSGEQDTFHRRHLVTDFAREVMDFKCSSCHQGNDPREETANSAADTDSTLVQRKMVDPDVCLMCHGRFDAKVMGLPGDWAQFRDSYNNDCLICHAAIRTQRHQVNFLKADAIEKAAKERGGDVCYGCHGGRAWFRIPYPYARHAWSGMAPAVPEWARDRPTESQSRFRLSSNVPPN